MDQLKLRQLNLYQECFSVIGNGNMLKGANLVHDIAVRIAEARDKHPEFATGLINAAWVVHGEMDELLEAAIEEPIERAEDEALDVVVTAVRLINREYKNPLEGSDASNG